MNAAWWLVRWIAATWVMLVEGAKLSKWAGAFPLLKANPAHADLFLFALVVTCTAWGAVLASRGNVIAALRKAA